MFCRSFRLREIYHFQYDCRFDGTDLRSSDRAGYFPKEARKQNEIAFVFQEHTLLPWAKLIDNVTMPLTLRGVSKKERITEGSGF